MKQFLFIILSFIALLTSGQEQKHLSLIEEGKVWRYTMLNAYAGGLVHIYELRFEGTETFDDMRYYVCNEYLDGVNLSEKLGPYGYFREEANGNLYYRGNAVGAIDLCPIHTWNGLCDENPNFSVLSPESAREMDDILVYSYEQGILIQHTNPIACDEDGKWAMEYIKYDFVVGDEYTSPTGNKLKIHGYDLCYLGLKEFVPLIVESIGYTSGTLVDCSRIDGTLLYGLPNLFEVLNSEGEIIYRKSKVSPRIENYTRFLEKGKTWKYLSRNCKSGHKWDETIELRIGDWDYVAGCRYGCYLYRNGSDKPEQNRPWCYLWEGGGRLTACWNNNYQYSNPETHKNIYGSHEHIVIDLANINKSDTYLFDSLFAEVDYTGADGKKYLCYQNSEGTQLIEGVGFVFDGRPASLVGPIDDTAEEYTDRWYLYSVVDADGTEIYSDPRYRPGSGVFSVAADDTPTEYYNLQGVRVANPTTGLYIVRQGEKAAVKFLK